MIIYRDYMVVEKIHFQNIFRPHENEKPAFSNFSGLKNVLEKCRRFMSKRRNKAALSHFSTVVWIDCCFVSFWCSFLSLLEKQTFLTVISLAKRPKN